MDEGIAAYPGIHPARHIVDARTATGPEGRYIHGRVDERPWS